MNNVAKFGIIPSAGASWEMPAGLSHEWPLALNGNDIIGTAHLTGHNISYSGGWSIFNGINAYYDVPSAGVPPRNADWSEEYWINADAYGTIVSFVSSLGYRQFYLGSSYGVGGFYRGVDSTNHHFNYPDSNILNTDFQVIITHEQGVATKLYVNGILVDTDTYTGNEATGSIGNYIGQQSSGVSMYDGKFKKRRTWNGVVLTADDVSGLWNNGNGR